MSRKAIYDWDELMSEFNSRNMTPTEFCEEKGIKRASFYVRISRMGLSTMRYTKEEHDKWIQIIQSAEKSGVAGTKYCRMNNIPYSKFQYFKGVYGSSKVERICWSSAVKYIEESGLSPEQWCYEHYADFNNYKLYIAGEFRKQSNHVFYDWCRIHSEICNGNQNSVSWCKEHNIPLSSYSSWKHKMRKAGML